jgi:hypothetical protein
MFQTKIAMLLLGLLSVSSGFGWNSYQTRDGKTREARRVGEMILRNTTLTYLSVENTLDEVTRAMAQAIATSLPENMTLERISEHWVHWRFWLLAT